MTKIVSIGGQQLPQPDLVDPKIVETLERWLNDAKSGDLKGVVLSGNYQNGDAGSAWAGMISINMLGSLHLLLHKLTLVLTADDTDRN